MNKRDTHYSGPQSRAFWRRVNTLPRKGDKRRLYSCGVLLQNLEGTVLLWLEMAEKRRARKSKGASS